MKIFERTMILILIIFVIIEIFILFIPTNLENTTKEKTELDSLKNVIAKKDSIIFAKEIEFKNQFKSDSVRLYLINKSINNIRYEIQKNSQSVWIVPDSLHYKFVDSIRSTEGFHKIQRK